MLGKLNKKDLAARAKKMKATAQALPAEDLKLKVVAETAPAPTDDEETYYGRVFKRRRKAAMEPSELSVSDRRAPSPEVAPPCPPPPNLQTGYHCQTPSVSGPQNDKRCFSTRSAEPYGWLSARSNFIHLVKYSITTTRYFI